MSRLRLLSIVSLTALAAACSESESTECGPDVFCPPGFQCIAELSYCINPLETLCGNGVQDEGEECDDGNLTNGDGCSWNCRIPVCGDRLVDTYERNGVLVVEACDDGNTSDGDGCSRDCTSVELCGDGLTNPLSYTLQAEAYGQAAGTTISRAEECDPAPGGVHEAATEECNLDCTRSRCGDGKVNAASGEECDPGTGTVSGSDGRALAPSADCNADCTIAVCGDGKTNPNYLPRLGSNQGEQCDLGRFCGDAELTRCETNDDCIALGNAGAAMSDLECKTRNLACCTAECFSTTCGDNILQNAFVCPKGTSEAECTTCQNAWIPEQCDDGNRTNADGCDNQCRSEECGDGQVTTHAYPRLRSVAAGGRPNAEGTGLDYEFPANTLVTAPEICDDGKQCAVNGKQCTTDADCIDGNGDVIGDGRCLPRNGDGCSADCLSRETCGANDGFFNDYPVLVCRRGEDGACELDEAGEPIPVAGGVRPPEVCDDGNNNPSGGNDVCSATCNSTGICGNSFVDAGESCDYGRLNGTGLVPNPDVESFCRRPDHPEDQADPTRQDCSFPCNTECTLNVQGDGKVDPGEQCDDGTTCADGSTCASDEDCAELALSDLTCKHRDDDNCTFQGRLNLCGDGIRNLIGGWTGLDGISPELMASLRARFGDAGIPKQVCDADGINDVDCDRDCTLPECGDVILCANLPESATCNPNTPLVNYSANETCDNGPGDAAGETAESENCNTNCKIAFCGDGVTNATRGERCDDNNNVDGDGCAGNCLSQEFCGDRVTNRYEVTVKDGANQVIAHRPAEVCDEGPEGGDDCTADCQSTRICGDRYINDNEGCDDGNTGVNDGCSDTCEVEVGWTCTSSVVTVGAPPIPGFVTYTTTASCEEVCGDGKVVGSETCDDGNTNDGDGCSSTCKVELGWECGKTEVQGELYQDGGACTPICGDRLIRTGETCDDGNVDSDDGCSASCQREPGYDCPCSFESGFVCGTTGGIGGVCISVCGDGEVFGFEECDDNNTIAGDGCFGCRIELGWSCPPAGGECSSVCGDYVIRGDEECDDGNTVAGDGCDAACQKESGWACPAGMQIIGGECLAVCGDGFVRGEESCDDGNVISGDGCDSGCKIELGWECVVNTATGVGGPCDGDCGDGLIRGTETCDEGSIPPTGGCDECQVNVGWECPTAQSTGGQCVTICGDGVHTTVTGTYAALNEECDNGSANADNAPCTAACKLATCSDNLRRTVGDDPETDVDCGGACATGASPQRCDLYEGCSTNNDCLTNYCDTSVGACVQPPILSGTFYALLGEELDIDIVEDLFGGNAAIDLETFEVVDGSASACGGALDYDVQVDGTLVFTAVSPDSATVGAGCSVGVDGPYTDSFTYEVCAESGACFSATVTVVINRPPVVADFARCYPINTANAQLDVRTIYTDADAHPLNAASITSTQTTVSGSPSRNGSVVTFTPTNAATARTHTVAVKACDVFDPTGCDTGTWTLTWNDPPVLASKTGANRIKVFATEVAAAQTQGSIVTSLGTINTTIASMTVGGSQAGPFGPTSVTSLGSCAVVNNSVVYTAGANPGTDRCWVRVCEACSGADVCSVAELEYQVLEIPQANDDQVFGIQAANPATTGATATFTRASLLSNDRPVGLGSFALNAATTVCNGTIALSGETLTYTGPAGLAANAPCRTADSFTYRACSPDDTSRCDNATVHIEINRLPALSNAFTCSPVDTPSRSLNVSDLFSDADGDLLVSSSIEASGTGGNASRAGNVVTWTPTNAATAGTYSVNLKACDDATVSGCATAVWTARWNDPPLLRQIPDTTPIVVFTTEDSTQVLKTGDDRLIVSTGTVTGVESGEPFASIAVGRFANGPFAASTTTALGGTCAIQGDDLVYTAGTTPGNDSCFLQVCETCSGNNVCAVTRVPFKVVPPPTAAADSVMAGEDADGRARGSFPVSSLVANDQNVDPATLTIQAGPGCTGAQASVANGVVSYNGPANIATCGVSDSFTYRVCSPDSASRCVTATVTVEINRAPAFSEAFTCVPAGTTRSNYTVAAPNFTDSDGDGVGVVSAVAAPGSPGVPTVAGETVTWTPDDRDLARLYTVDLLVCDNAADPACTPGTWKTVWNDVPNLADTFSVGCVDPTPGTLCAGANSSVELPLLGASPDRLVLNEGAVKGVASGNWIGAVTIERGPTAGTCTVVESGGVATGIRYTAPAVVAAMTTDSCEVRVCELCDGGPVCSTREIAIQVYPVSQPGDDELAVLSTSPAVALTVARSHLTANDTNIKQNTFALVSGATTCGGTVAMSGNGNDVVYTPPTPAEAALPACNWLDSFQYRVERVGVGGTVNATVAIELNQAPVLNLTDANSFQCRPLLASAATLALNDPLYTDPDDLDRRISELTGTAAGATVDANPGQWTVTLTPTNVNVAQRYAVTVTAKDDAARLAGVYDSRGSATGTWNVVWNDGPVLNEVPTVVVSAGSSEQILFSDIVAGVGATNGLPVGSVASPYASVKVGTSASGPFGVTAPLGGGASCEVVGVGAAAQVVVTGGTSELASGCFVEVCEVCDSSPACTVTEISVVVNACVDDLDCVDGTCDEGVCVAGAP